MSLLKVKEVAERWQCDTSTIRRYINEGVKRKSDKKIIKLEATKLSNLTLRISEEAVDKFIDDCNK
jgi:predicted site-specific integrase-resolvase